MIMKIQGEKKRKRGKDNKKLFRWRKNMNMKGEGGGGFDRNAQYIPLKNLISTNVNLASMI